MNRQRLILFILLIALAGAVTWSFFATPRPKVAPSSTSAPGQGSGGRARRATATSAPPADSRILKLELLKHEQGGFKGYRRDLFRPIFVDELKLMQKKAAALKPVKPLPPPPPPAPPVPVAPAMTAAEAQAQRDQRELGKFIFKGFLSKYNQKTVFLSKDGNILLVKKGDVFERRFKAVSITDKALVIQVTDSSEKIVIPLVENLSLKAVP